jgi:polynucleotide kinase-phosphatase
MSLVVLVGPSGAGKSSFAARHFRSTEIISSDFCRGLVSDDENSQEATGDAFDLVHYMAGLRLRRGNLTVIDATNVDPSARKPLVALAREHDVMPVAIVFDIPEKVCRERNLNRPDRDLGAHVIRRQQRQMRRSIRGLQREGFRYVHRLRSPEEVESVAVLRQPLWNDRRGETGPFDIIGDVHGCLDELLELLREMGYQIRTLGSDGGTEYDVRPPEGRKALFVGDLVDRGPNTPGVLRLVMDMVEADRAICIPGNHDVKLLRALRGRKVTLAHGLAESLEQLAEQPEEFRGRVVEFIDGLVSHYVLDDGKLVVAHAGMKERFQGRASGRVRSFALYGDTTGETDEFGLPVRQDWAREYRGRATVVYGHTPVPEALWLNQTMNVDTGCVFGGMLTALRYPEREIVSVQARQVYAQPARPFLADETADRLTAQHREDEVLEIEDVVGRRIVQTRLRGNLTIREENAAAALEVMSRFAANPKWLIYLPPTMSPGKTSQLEGLLEHPTETFAYYRQEGIPRVVCEEKHMGSRAVVVLCRDEDVARRRFGVVDDGFGVIYTRTGRRFFDDRDVEVEVLSRMCDACDAAGVWNDLNTDWMCLDAELMPWSVKARELLRDQYAAVGAAGRTAMSVALDSLSGAAARGQAKDLYAEFERRRDSIGAYTSAYRRYCWNVTGVSDMKLAPFHLLASEGAVHVNRDHAWHMETLAQVCAADEELLLATPWRMVDLTEPESEAEATRWWTELTKAGGEGMVVKPLDFLARGRKGLAQPAVKVRGPEYLRIIYGPSYDEPENLERLRNRGLGHKRSMALRELALGIEGLERFVRGEPLRRVHECVFGVLALESEPVDPRL